MKAVLVQPPIFWTTTPPLGPAYLAAELLAAGDDVRLLDFNIELYAADGKAYKAVEALASEFGHTSPLRQRRVGELPNLLRWSKPHEWAILVRLVESWAAAVLAEEPDLVGLSLHEGSFLAGLLLACEIRKQCGPAPLLIAGGPEAVFLQADPRPIVDGILDAVVVGEGEGPLRELAARVRGGEIQPHRDGLGSRPLRGALIRSEAGELLSASLPAELVDIHTIALPSFDGLPLDAYSFHRTLPILCGRGCPAKCTFCFETVMWAQFRLRTVESVVGEIKQRLAHHDAPLSFRFNDSLLNGDLAWLERFSEALLEERLDIKWHGNARIHPRMTRAYLEKLARAGLTGFLYGVESGSDKILRRMKKGVRAADIPEVLQNTYLAGLWTHAFLILDFPGEGDVEALETLDLLLQRLPDLDSLVFHDFHLPRELVEYVDFPGRVPLEDEMELQGPKLFYQSNVAALKPYIQVFLENFLAFAHTYGKIHYVSLPAAHARALLQIYRERWRASEELARGRLALAAVRALLAELQRRGLTALLQPEHANLPLLQDRKILHPNEGAGLPEHLDESGRKLTEGDLARLVYCGVGPLAAAIRKMARQWPTRRALPEGSSLLEELALSLGEDTSHTTGPLVMHESFAPEGLR
jgi:radical SAM superfamily enzyme YgiQ (UPF0313 family)